jgi:hypothetical protein
MTSGGMPRRVLGFSSSGMTDGAIPRRANGYIAKDPSATLRRRN